MCAVIQLDRTTLGGTDAAMKLKRTTINASAVQSCGAELQPGQEQAKAQRGDGLEKLKKLAAPLHCQCLNKSPVAVGRGLRVAWAVHSCWHLR